ncbi:hypothetical protein DQ240_03165 [Blastococcus sp. TF02A-26]|nr:hypothetical protein DQ240_03165 [Blastococcus sp. TF02A-26]
MRVLRPVRVRQVSAGLAVAAAVAGLLSLALSLDTTRFFYEGEELEVVTRIASGEVLGEGGFSLDTLAWAGPTVLAVVLLGGAAVGAVLAARSDRPGPWGAAAQQLAAGATGLLAGVTGVVVVFGVSDVSAYRVGEGVVTRWGPAPLALAIAAVLALAATLTARRGSATVLATIGAGEAS